ncbi:MAG: hypothetical protein M1830_008632 [Pleopsidium flavum]|nr:MAG: hypothetical protein M1830_008632 [Pleopsidium flavum]
MSDPPCTIATNTLVAPRPRKGILTPTTENTLNVNDNTTRTSTKRKRSQRALQDLLGEPFVIRPHPSPLFDKARTLTPLLLLPRSCLPLSYLEPVPLSTAIPSARLFSAHVRALEDIEPNAQDTALVMVTELETDESLYAVERVRPGLYALCMLGSWVKIRDLHAAALVARDDSTSIKHKSLKLYGQGKWWDSAALKLSEANREVTSKRPKIEVAGLVNLTMKPPISENFWKTYERPTIPTPLDSGAISGVPTSTSGPGELQRNVEPYAQELFDMIRCQYLETLYLSKTSLAYFAKGPLSRIRASFQPGQKTLMALSDLVEFLRASISPLALLDSKYREAVPKIIEALPIGHHSEEEGNPVLLPTTERKSKKKRIGKDGLYSAEHAFVAKWWRARDLDNHDGAANESRVDEAKRLIVDLRIRETQLQLILILEVLALEASIAVVTNIDKPCENATPEPTKGDLQIKKRRAKKPQDLNLLLELLIDRLSIWQSVSLPEESSGHSILTDTCNNRQPIRNEQKGVASARVAQNDRLRDFSSDVIVPFYAARLPECCSTISHKLGGMKAPSPMRLPMLKPATTSRGASGPGTVINRNAASRPRRALERVLTNDKPTSQPLPPSLRRSATAPAVPGLKRESSEVSLSDIPIKRAGVERSKRYSQREVDLGAISQATEARSKKKALVDEELRVAIATLKRPNRGLAVKELTESVEQRVSGVGTSSRKSKNPVRNPFGQGVQVMATPKGNRKKNVFSRRPIVARGQSPEVDEAPHPIPPSCDPRIPASVARAAMLPQFPSSEFCIPQSLSHPVRQTPLSAVMQTPTRGTSRLVNVITDVQADRHPDELGQPSSPGLPKRRTSRDPGKASQPELWETPSYTSTTQSSLLHETPLRRTNATGLQSPPRNDVKDTPVRRPRNSRTNSGAAVDCRKTLPDSYNPESSRSIYQSLGWDEDADDLI